MGPNISGEDWIFHIQCWNIQSRRTKLGGQNFHDMPPDSPTLHTYTSNIHVIPLQKILAMGLLLYNQISTETLFLWTPVMQKSDHRKLIVALHTKVIFTSRRIKLKMYINFTVSAILLTTSINALQYTASYPMIVCCIAISGFALWQHSLVDYSKVVVLFFPVYL